MGMASCSGRGHHVAIIPDVFSSDSAMVEFAQGFTMEKHGDITLLTVANPWQGAQNVMYRYVLCPKGKDIPPEFAPYTVIHTPVERVVCLSTTHVAMLSALGKTSSIKALSGTAFVSDSAVRKAIDKGLIVDIGYEQSLNYERIISLKPDIIFAYGVDGDLTGSLTRLAGLGQKIVFNAEYLERTPLGKAEWIKFMAAFYGCEDHAREKFDVIRDEYLSLCRLAESREQKPKILCGLPWQGIWYIPGGNTWMAAMIADAGGEYIWKDNTSHESIPINIETIVHQGGTADLWINTGSARTLIEIRSVDERLSLIKPFKAGAVYNNYARIGTGGGNDFLESGVINPHIILKDMIQIFHPDLLPEHQLYYYMKVE
jgi:iron complex transport system substrate-binding protein